MFGYLRIQKSELLVKEYEAYKAVYCGLCRQLGRDYSFPARLALSYDCTFYALILMSLGRSCTGFSDGRCVVNPLKKCKFALCETDCYSKAAALTVIFVYFKLKDNIADNGFFSRLGAYLALPLFGRWRKKAAGRFPELDRIASELSENQYREEHSETSNVDSAAHPTATALARLLTLEARDERQRLIFHELGYQLGRWIYFADAADDLKKDKKRGGFNPFLSLSADNSGEYISSLLNQTLARAYNAYKLIEIQDFKGILENMLVYGFPLVQNNILKGMQSEVINE